MLMVSPEEPRPVVEIANGAVRMTCRHQSCETDQPRGHATGTEIPPSAAVATSRWTGRLSSVPVRKEAAVENFGQLLVLGSCYVYVATKVGAIRQIPLRAAKKHKQKSTLLVRVSEDGWRQRLLVRARTGRGGVDQADLGNLHAFRSLRQKLEAILPLRKLFDIVHVVRRECRAEQRT